MAGKDSIEVVSLSSELLSQEIVDLIGRAIAERLRKRNKKTQARYIQGHLIYRANAESRNLFWLLLQRVAGMSTKANREKNTRPCGAREVHWRHPLCEQALQYVLKLGKEAPNA